MNPFFVLGEDTAQMRLIEDVLANKRVPYGYAATTMGRWMPGEVATRVLRPSGKPARIEKKREVFTVECRVEGLDAAVIDHRHPGDPGFDYTPQQFWKGSSLGQVIAELDIHGHFVRIDRPMHAVAATDFCFVPAMRGECPGVTPQEVYNCRIGRLRLCEPLQTLQGAIKLWCKVLNRNGPLYNATHLKHDWIVCQLAEIAALKSSTVVLIRQSLSSQRHKVMLLGNVSPQLALSFTEWCATVENITSVQYAPARGMACADWLGDWDEQFWSNLDWAK